MNVNWKTDRNPLVLNLSGNSSRIWAKDLALVVAVIGPGEG